jgi:hypothetical protein
MARICPARWGKAGLKGFTLPLALCFLALMD